MSSSPILIQCPCGITFPIEDSSATTIQCDCPACGLTLQADLIEGDPAADGETDGEPDGAEKRVDKGTGPGAHSGGKTAGNSPGKATAKTGKKDFLTRIVCSCGKRFKVDSLGKKDFRISCPACQKKLKIGNPKSRKHKKKQQRSQASPVDGPTCSCGAPLKPDPYDALSKWVCTVCHRSFDRPSSIAASGRSRRSRDQPGTGGPAPAGGSLLDPLTLGVADHPYPDSRTPRVPRKRVRSGLVGLLDRIPYVPLIVATIGTGLVLLGMLVSLAF